MRQYWKPGNLLNPVPAVLVTAAGRLKDLDEIVE